MSVINSLSFTSFYTEVFYNDIKLSTATSFVYSYNNKQYLVTNYHVAFGLNPNNGTVLDERGLVPNKIICNFLDKNMNSKSLTISYIDDINPFKFISINGVVADIALLELKDVEMICINNIKSISNIPRLEQNIKLEITNQLFVLGYPRGINILNTPIWKRSSIASEPCINVNGLPYFYIDTTTREGMSGAPVIFYSSEGIYNASTNHTLAAGPTYKFVGIYSGRDCAGDPYLAQLGRVWKRELIDRIIEENFS